MRKPSSSTRHLQTVKLVTPVFATILLALIVWAMLFHGRVADATERVHRNLRPAGGRFPPLAPPGRRPPPGR